MSARSERRRDERAYTVAADLLRMVQAPNPCGWALAWDAGALPNAIKGGLPLSLLPEVRDGLPIMESKLRA
jgi:hypothetical protein